MKTILDIFLSLKTAFGLFIAGIAICFIGSLMLPANLAFFSGIDDTPLFKWLSDADKLNLTWWIYALIAVITLLSLSTILCTADALLKGFTVLNVIARLSPQVMHIGVLLVLLGHLLTAAFGIRQDLLIRKGETKPLSVISSIRLADLNVKTDESGYFTDWEARITHFEGENKSGEAVLKPIHPVYFSGLGLFFKSISMEEESALIRVCRDPGAAWALIGGVLVVIGGAGFLYSRFRGF